MCLLVWSHYVILFFMLHYYSVYIKVIFRLFENDFIDIFVFLWQGDYIWIEPVTGREFDVAIGARVISAEGRRIQVKDDDGKVCYMPHILDKLIYFPKYLFGVGWNWTGQRHIV